MKFSHREGDAKTKWCPFARAVSRIGNGEHVINRSSGDINVGVNCVASACMAWRWVETHIDDPAGGSEMILSGDTHGFCGMAVDPRMVFP